MFLPRALNSQELRAENLPFFYFIHRELIILEMMALPLRRFRRAPENLWRKVFDGGTLFVLLVILYYIPGNYSYNSYVSINIGIGQDFKVFSNKK